MDFVATNLARTFAGRDLYDLDLHDLYTHVDPFAWRDLHDLHDLLILEAHV